jgi:dTDP-4-dehydrorhamnose reductase
LSNETPDSGISWFDFAAEIFRQADIRIRLIPCASDEYPTKAVRPKFSKMRNGSAIRLGDWKEGLEGYFSR